MYDLYLDGKLSSPLLNEMTMTEEKITYSWTHPTMELVDHYNVLMDSLTTNQLFQVTSTEVTISRFSDLSTVLISAVDHCGRESPNVEFLGNVVALVLVSTTIKGIQVYYDLHVFQQPAYSTS